MRGVTSLFPNSARQTIRPNLENGRVAPRRYTIVLLKAETAPGWLIGLVPWDQVSLTRTAESCRLCKLTAKSLRDLLYTFEFRVVTIRKSAVDEHGFLAHTRVVFRPDNCSCVT